MKRIPPNAEESCRMLFGVRGLSQGPSSPCEVLKPSLFSLNTLSFVFWEEQPSNPPMGGDCTVPSAPFAPLWHVADQFVTRTAHSPTCSVSFLQTGTIKPSLQPVELLWHFQFSSVLLWHLSWEELLIVFLPSLNLMGLGKWCFQYFIIFFSNFWINVSLSPSASESLHNSCTFSCPLIYRSVLPLFSSNTKSCFQQWDERRNHRGKTAHI